LCGVIRILRDQDTESRARWTFLQNNGSVVSNHKRLNYGQPQARASGLPGCGEEWGEDPVRVGRGYTRAVILNRDFNDISSHIVLGTRREMNMNLWAAMLP